MVDNLNMTSARDVCEMLDLFGESVHILNCQSVQNLGKKKKS